MEIDQVEAFVAIVRGRGFTRAASALHLSQPAVTTLTGCLQGFRKAYPHVQMRLRTALSREVSALVRRGDATLGLRYGIDPHPELVGKVIYDEPRVVACSPRHRLARSRTVAPKMLAGEAWIAFPARPDEPAEYLSGAARRLIEVLAVRPE